MNFNLELDVTRTAERYTRTNFERISTIEFDENEEAEATSMAMYIDSNKVNEIKDFMCKPLKIKDKIFGGYAKTCPLCGALVQTELTGMRLYTHKDDNGTYVIISCPNCYETLRYSTDLDINMEDLKNNYLTISGYTCGEKWEFHRKKIRIGHKAILNKFNE